MGQVTQKITDLSNFVPSLLAEIGIDPQGNDELVENLTKFVEYEIQNAISKNLDPEMTDQAIQELEEEGTNSSMRLIIKILELNPEAQAVILDVLDEIWEQTKAAANVLMKGK